MTISCSLLQHPCPALPLQLPSCPPPSQPAAGPDYREGRRAPAAGSAGHRGAETLWRELEPPCRLEERPQPPALPPTLRNSSAEPRLRKTSKETVADVVVISCPYLPAVGPAPWQRLELPPALAALHGDPAAGRGGAGGQAERGVLHPLPGGGAEVLPGAPGRAARGRGRAAEPALGAGLAAQGGGDKPGGGRQVEVQPPA